MARFFLITTAIALALALAMSILSAWIRLSDSGLGCTPWPECYGEHVTIDASPGVTIAAADTNKGLRVTHRFMASVFGLLMLGITTIALWYRRTLPIGLLWPAVALAITIVLALVGMNTPDIRHPAVATTNLVGGMSLALVLLHILLEQTRPSSSLPPAAIASAAGLIVILTAVASGAWVSANYAAGSCEDSLSCRLPDQANLTGAFDPARELNIEGSSVVGSAADSTILFVHQATGPIVAFVVIFCTIIAIAIRGYEHWMAAPPLAIAAIVVVAMIAGSQPSLALASLHNLLSLVLMMTFVYQIHQLRQP